MQLRDKKKLEERLRRALEARALENLRLMRSSSVSRQSKKLKGLGVRHQLALEDPYFFMSA